MGQAAHQAATHSGDLGGVQAEVLTLGHPNRNGVKTTHESGTTQAMPARTQSSGQPCAVPNSHRAHFDPLLVSVAEVPQERSKIHPLFRSEKNQNRLARQWNLGTDRPNLQVEFSRSAANVLSDLKRLLLVLLVNTTLFGYGKPENSTRSPSRRSDNGGCETGHPSQEFAVAGFNDHFIIMSNDQRTRSTDHRLQFRNNDHTNQILT